MVADLIWVVGFENGKMDGHRLLARLLLVCVTLAQ